LQINASGGLVESYWGDGIGNGNLGFGKKDWGRFSSGVIAVLSPTMQVAFWSEFRIGGRKLRG
jgi:hypothetical protein